MQSSLIRGRAKAALQLSFIADALAMPVHWFYNPLDIYRAFSDGVEGFAAAPAFHPSSIMSLHSTNAGGRGKQATSSEPQVVGDVILKGKRQYWGIANQHYHRGMRAGENTLNLHCMRVVLRCLNQHGGRYERDSFLRDYIAFMTAGEPQHPDTYAESFHRGFFANLVNGKPAHKCGAATHDTASIGGLVMIAPIAIAELLYERSLKRVQDVCRTHLFLTHPDEQLAAICDVYVALIDALLFREFSSTANIQDARLMIAAAAKKTAGVDLAQIVQKHEWDNQVIGKLFSRACYIEDSWPSVLYLAWKYLEDPRRALIANTNLGGDNCHRGAVLGVLLGLATAQGLDDWFDQLVEANSLRGEIYFETH